MLEQKARGNQAVLLKILGTVIAVVLLIILFRNQGWEEILQAIKSISYWRLVLVLILTVISRFAVTARWHVLLVSAGLKISFKQSLQITFAGLFASNFLPSTVGGDVVRLAGILRLGQDKAKSLASLVVDRLVGMAGMGLATLILLFYLPAILDQYSRVSRNLLVRSGLEYILGLTIVGPNESRRKKIWLWFLRGIKKLWQALLIWTAKPAALLLALGFTTVHMGCLFTSIWLFLPDLGEKMPFGLVAGLWGLTYFMTLIPVSLNGLGVQELSITFFYTHFGGISMASSLTIALLLRIYPIIVSLPGALTIPGLVTGKIGGNTGEIE